MKNRIPIFTTRLIGAGLLAAAIFLSVGQNILVAEPPPDPTHAAHVASGAMPPDAPTGDPSLSEQLSQAKAKMAQLEAALAKNAPPAPIAAASPAGAMPGMPATTTPATSAPPMADTKGGVPGAMKQEGGTGMDKMEMGGMMGMMDKMMDMMDKMMSMSGGHPGGSSMEDGGMDKMGTGGGTMPEAAQTGKMPAGGMGMDKMKMAGMMGMAKMGGDAAGALPQSPLPGFPGASHLYHIGATDFFLDHPEHITTTTEQQAGLNKVKEQALLAKSTADRALEQAEQALWMLTAADQPDATQVEAKIREIEKLRGDERLAFIRAVGDASKLLTDEQRKILTGFAPPAPASPMATPATAMPAGGMKDM